MRGGAAALLRATVGLGGRAVRVRRDAPLEGVVAFVFAVALSAALGVFVAVHLYLAATNQTTAEWGANRAAAAAARRGRQRWRNRHDEGSAWRNLASALGVAPSKATFGRVLWAATWPLAPPGRAAERARDAGSAAKLDEGGGSGAEIPV